MAESYKQLQVWQKSIDLVDDYYDATEDFHRDELFGLRSQMRRAAVSIPSNIAEGQARHSRRDFIRFLRASKGSLAELRTQTIIAERRRYLDRETCCKLDTRAAEVDRMLSGLISSLGEILERVDEN